MSVCSPAVTRAIAPETAGHLTTVLKALADPLRLRIVSSISVTAGGEACVCDFTELADVSQPTISHHLKVLKDAGVVTSERRGTWVWYALAPGLRGAVTALLDGFAPAATSAPSPATAPEPTSDAQLDRIADELSTAYPALHREEVLRTVRESYTALARSATVGQHLLNLAYRFSRQRLADLTRNPPGAPPQILFLCVANAGRSQLAAALVHHYAGEQVVVRSAGSSPGADIHPHVRTLLEEIDADVTSEAFPKPLTDDAVRAADVIVTMGCGDVCPILPGKRYEDWAVGDPALASPEGVAAIRDDIAARVRTLLASLGITDIARDA